MLALSENIIIAQNAIESRWPWLLLVELRVKDDADTYRRWAQHGADVVTMLTTYGGSGCVGHWKLNDNDWSAVVVDSSGNGNHGTAQRKTVHLHTNGITNGAFKQNGTTDYVNMGNVLDRGISDFSVAAWVRSTNTDILQYAESGVLTKKHTGAINNAGWSVSFPSGRVFFMIADGVSGEQVISDGGYNDGEFHHIVAVADKGTDLRVYVDGSLDGTKVETTIGDVDSSVNLFLGNTAGTAHHFDGTIDNVRLFDKALTPAEISALYNSGRGTELVPATFDAFNFTLNQILYKGGEVPKTTLRFSNVTQFLKADLAANDGLTGSEITLRMVHANMLYEDYSELDVTFDIIYPKITAAYVEFVIGGPSPLRRRVPIDIYFADACRYIDGFKTDPRCDYAGAETTCSGLRNRCRELDNEIRFGGFPGLRPETMRLA